jgi:NADH:ubiquinone oxidoreductase subunit
MLLKDLWAGFDSNLPSEWESWLRHRRPEPPSEQEIMQVSQKKSFLKELSNKIGY